eukprot:TRINITY_DN41263_c0_g1_i1.p1 TRINITY_DN41263_c0_g1~~TRINITY_DN41263_c0_g1_i1.p1  ORF type:complete len:134 (-),score=9.98 TRINITY_DN41263_c0_g1_i1:635-1036(-)
MSRKAFKAQASHEQESPSITNTSNSTIRLRTSLEAYNQSVQLDQGHNAENPKLDQSQTHCTHLVIRPVGPKHLKVQLEFEVLLKLFSNSTAAFLLSCFLSSLHRRLDSSMVKVYIHAPHDATAKSSYSYEPDP